jgi:hypothetical protein
MDHPSLVKRNLLDRYFLNKLDLEVTQKIDFAAQQATLCGMSMHLKLRHDNLFFCIMSDCTGEDLRMNA